MVAQEHTGEYKEYISFSKSIDNEKFGAVAVFYAHSGTIKRKWLTKDGEKEADISPLLMAEFGSGHMASDAAGLPNAEIAKSLGMGQGTFPDQTHAFEPEWYWMDLDEQWHSSSGETPTMPMFNAAIAIENEVFAIAKEVFGS